MYPALRYKKLSYDKQKSGDGAPLGVQAGFHPILSNFSPVFVTAMACTTEEDDVQEWECQWKEELLKVTLFSSNKLDLQRIFPISI